MEGESRTHKSSLHRITIMNMKGGCGKSTIAINLSAYYATHGYVTALTDHDPQASSINWLRRRDENRPIIHGIDASKRQILTIRSDQLLSPAGTQISIIDTPAGIGLDDISLRKLLKNTDTLLIPVLPSPIDIHAAAHFIETLLIHGRVKVKGINIGIVANRVRPNTISYQLLQKFLNRLNIPFVASFNEAQNYVFANEKGLGIHELNKSRNVKDLEQWQILINWLDLKAAEIGNIQ